MRHFMVLWLGQLVSLLGSGLTTFALGIWVFQRTGSVTSFSLLALFSALPGILFAPIAGALIDRYEKRRVLAVSNLGSALTTGLLVALVASDRADLWILLTLLATASVFQALLVPGLIALTTRLVDKGDLMRANGMNQLGDAAVRIVAPLIAATLLPVTGLVPLLMADVVSFLVAAGGLFLLPAIGDVVVVTRSGWRSLLNDAAQGWRIVRAQTGLGALLMLFAGFNFIGAMVQVLLTPLVLSFGGPRTLGAMMTCAGTGILAGGLLASLWRGPVRRVRWILGLSLVQALVLFLAGFRPSAWLVGGSIVVFATCTPIVNALSQVIWQERTPLEVQGRAFAIRRMVALSTLPPAYLLAGPLADRVFEPAMQSGGVLAARLGALVGVGEGRGIALLIILLGVVALVMVLAAWRHRPLLAVERAEDPVQQGVPLSS